MKDFFLSKPKKIKGGVGLWLQSKLHVFWQTAPSDVIQCQGCIMGNMVHEDLKRMAWNKKGILKSIQTVFIRV